MDSLYRQYTLASQNTPERALLLDRDALDKNIAWVAARANGKRLRLATKSIRSVDVLKEILGYGAPFQGLMTYSLAEALWLRQEGFQDLLMGYPSYELSALHELGKNPEDITLMVDGAEHLTMLSAIATEHKTTFDICVDVDMSMDLPMSRFGVYRSSIRTQEDLTRFLAVLKNSPGLRLVGLMGYEAQIAGVGDKKSGLIRWLKKRSWKQLLTRRQVMTDFVKNSGYTLRLVNGGGSGSLVRTSGDDNVTEVTVGSAFYASVLFDDFLELDLTPALFLSSTITRHPKENIYTMAGMGYIASGEVGAKKQPTIWLPKGLTTLRHEGFGEVQTPVCYTGSDPLSIGSKIFLRGAKAGEICEHFNDMYWIRGEQVIKEGRTYRGLGKSFG